ncbi:transposase [Streptomyces sp. NPDC001777]|uniref:transposase n=1 Tax=Streptomyces sp. NPDC001777 TaxID=3364608 RepID=UPI0036CA1926
MAEDGGVGMCRFLPGLRPTATSSGLRRRGGRGIAGFVSVSTVRRRPAEDAIKPCRHRSWIFPTDPGFRLKAARALHLYGCTEVRTGLVPFMNLVTQVMSIEPYASAKRVFWIVDHGSSHHGQKAAARLAAAFPNAVMVHTPIHASWLNQVEICFSLVQRKVVSPNDFTDFTEVRDRLRAFEGRYNATAQPFQRKFTTSGLDDLPAGLDRHTADHLVGDHGTARARCLASSISFLLPCGLKWQAAGTQLPTRWWSGSIGHSQEPGPDEARAAGCVERLLRRCEECFQDRRSAYLTHRQVRRHLVGISSRTS